MRVPGCYKFLMTAKHFPNYWPVVRGIHRSSLNSPHRNQWRGTLMFPLICTRISGWVNNREAGDLRRHRAHYDVNAMVMVRGLSNSYFLFYSSSDFKNLCVIILCVCEVNLINGRHSCSARDSTIAYQNVSYNLKCTSSRYAFRF